MINIHCKYCNCPIAVFEKNLKTYSGDECKLYHDFSLVIDSLEIHKKHFTSEDIYKECEKEFTGSFNDIPDLRATVNEMIEAHNELGIMPSNYVTQQQKQIGDTLGEMGYKVHEPLTVSEAIGVFAADLSETDQEFILAMLECVARGLCDSASMTYTIKEDNQTITKTITLFE